MRIWVLNRKSRPISAPSSPVTSKGSKIHPSPISAGAVAGPVSVSSTGKFFCFSGLAAFDLPLS